MRFGVHEVVNRCDALDIVRWRDAGELRFQERRRRGVVKECVRDAAEAREGLAHVVEDHEEHLKEVVVGR